MGQNWRWFTDLRGRQIAWGRSLVYRWTPGCFWSACACTHTEVLTWPETAWCWRSQKAFWSGQDILGAGGCLTLGYTYPLDRLGEVYIAHTSPYWLSKTWLALRQPETHPFWSGPAHPPSDRPAILPLHTCGGMLAGGADHPLLLLAGQYGPEWMVGAAARYSKFAYDTRHGFNLPADGEDPTPDNALLVRIEGTTRWLTRRAPRCWSVGKTSVRVEWEPLPGVHIRTLLRPWKGGHLRRHHITSQHPLETIEGGFPCPPGSSRLTSRSITLEGGGLRSHLQARDHRIASNHPQPESNNLIHHHTSTPVLHGKIPPGRCILRTLVWGGEIRSG